MRALSAVGRDAGTGPPLPATLQQWCPPIPSERMPSRATITPRVRARPPQQEAGCSAEYIQPGAGEVCTWDEAWGRWVTERAPSTVYSAAPSTVYAAPPSAPAAAAAAAAGGTPFGGYTSSEEDA